MQHSRVGENRPVLICEICEQMASGMANSKMKKAERVRVGFTLPPRTGRQPPLPPGLPGAYYIPDFGPRTWTARLRLFP
jgi:hypothetical protein